MGRVSDARRRLMDAAMDLIWESSYGSTTIDSICEKAGVKKGSFYYFFESKSDLALAALDAAWKEKKPIQDAIFSPTVPPLDRFKRYFDAVYQHQAEMRETRGRVLGCPLFTLGCEISTQDQRIREKVDAILFEYRKYFESAIRDAHAEQLLFAPNAETKARLLFAYFQGVLTQARIQNDLEVLRELSQGAMEVIGVRRAEAA
jgi:TetR/AcrR family transcriptional repressor of nem operon